MDRRTFLKTGVAAGGAAWLGGMPAPALSQGAAARTLRFVPQANLANFDPIWGTQYVVRNAAALVWEEAPFIPLGLLRPPMAYRHSLTGIVTGGPALFWNVRRG